MHKKTNAKLLMLSIAIVLCSCESFLNSATFHPNTKTRIPADQLPAHVQAVTIQSKDQQSIEALWFSHGDSVQKSILYFHGNAGNLYHRVSFAQTLWEMGVNVLLVSYRGYAQSTGTPSEKGVYLDGQAGLRYLQDSLHIPLDSITVFGRSLGSAVAVHTVQNQAVDKLILVTPFTSGEDMAKRMLPGFSVIAGGSFMTQEKLAKVNVPLLILHGTDDETIPFQMGQQLFQHYAGPKELIAIQGGAHNDLQRVDSLGYWGGIARFLTQD